MDLTDAHSKMVRDLYLDTERKANRNMADPPEYDLQQSVSDFYQDWLRNTEYSVARERGGKVDVLIYRKGQEHVFYELKTYFKANESIRKKELVSDAKKLAEKRRGAGVGARSYLLIAGRKNKLTNSSVPDFVRSHAEGDRAYFSLQGSPLVRLRPSRKEIASGATFVMTWEVIVDTE